MLFLLKKKVMDSDLGGTFFRKLVARDYASWIKLDIQLLQVSEKLKKVEQVGFSTFASCRKVGKKLRKLFFQLLQVAQQLIKVGTC